MADVEFHAQFEAAARDAANLSRRSDNNALLKIYAYYKQTAIGVVQGGRPGHNAGVKLKSVFQDVAMKRYIKLVEELQGK